jgi:hypothetical protein
MKKILLLLFTAISTGAYAQTDSLPHTWQKIQLPDSSCIQVAYTKVYFKINTQDRDLSENLRIKYEDQIKFVNVEYKNRGKWVYTIYFKMDAANEVLEYIQNIKTVIKN